MIFFVFVTWRAASGLDLLENTLHMAHARLVIISLRLSSWTWIIKDSESSNVFKAVTRENRPASYSLLDIEYEQTIYEEAKNDW